MVRLTLVLGGVGLLFAAAARGDAPPMDPGQFEPLRAAILPAESESAWLKIPWRTDLWQARREAAAAGKPILLWEMDGHPLGCT
jgi:hypothetical protein